MKFVELSLKDVEKESKKLYDIISKQNYNYDLVIFIAKGALGIGRKLADIKNVPLIEIKAERKGGKIKKFIKPVLRIVPKKILVRLREKEMKSSFHESNSERKVQFDTIIYEEYKHKKRILLVDDSIDSGFSVIETKKVLKDFFVDAEIKIAVFNVMDKSVIQPEFTLYKNTMICGPWSNDSEYNTDFTKEYKEWKNSYER